MLRIIYTCRTIRKCNNHITVQKFRNIKKSTYSGVYKLQNSKDLIHTQTCDKMKWIVNYGKGRWRESLQAEFSKNIEKGTDHVSIKVHNYSGR